jgi:hypothetical protein
MDPNVPNSDHTPSRSTILDLALQIGLIGLLVYACSRFISPFRQPPTTLGGETLCVLRSLSAALLSYL